MTRLLSRLPGQWGHRIRSLDMHTALAATALPLIVAAGCSSGSASPATAGSMAGPSVEPASAAPGDPRFVIAPDDARKMGYRVDWQFPSTGRSIERVVVQGDSVFTLDERNLLTRLSRDSGDRVWRIPVADALERVFGMTYAPADERVYLITGSDLLVLDAASGSRIGKQRLTKIANTAGVQVGQFLIYGARNGQVIWHVPRLGSTWRGYQISQSIQVPPIYADGSIVVVGNDGRIMCLDARSASQVWARRALDSIVSTPVAGNGAVYVASRDQHIRAYDLVPRPAPLWEYLTESPLVAAPVLAGDDLYQQVPTEGLVCLEALPIDSPGGVVRWRAVECRGTVRTRLGSTLIAWDESARRVDVLDAGRGAILHAIPMPSVDEVLATSTVSGDLYVTGTSGRIARLVPRSRSN